MYWVQVETVEAMDGDTKDVDKVFFNPVQLMNKMTENIFVTMKLREYKPRLWAQ